MDEGRVQANGVDFAYLADGPRDGALALLLHGFPDTAWTWRHLLPALAGQGYRAVAPFMRGYAPTAVPADGRYQTGALVADACALWQALGGRDDAVLIGHDWGAAAAYGAAVHGGPSMWSRVVTMAVPPAGTLGAGFLNYDQLKRSFYMFFFQTPLADVAVAMNDLDFIARLWQDWSPGYPYEDDVAHVRDALGDPAHLAAALGYYRALFDPSRHDPALAAEQAAAGGQPTQPLLYLHGDTDGCMGVDLARLYEGTTVVEGAGHFLQLEKPDAVNELVVKFLAS
jgi:pimeloyl-ACP methyl ester carboxylesterase